MVVRRLLAFGLALLSVSAASACGRASAEGAADRLGDEWPLSAIAVPETGPDGQHEAPESEEFVADVEDPMSDTRTETLRLDGDAGVSGDLGLTPDADSLVRPEMDMEASGPMIHTGPSESSDFPNARFARPEHVRGLYVNAWAAGSNRRMTAILDLARRTEVNSLVIDIKDATGYISHRTEVPLAHEIGATEEVRISDLPALLDRLEAEGIYPIARIVVVKDPILSMFRPEFAVQDTAGGVWIDSKDIIWLNPFSEGVWAYNTQIGREVAEMGFPEIQWDYIRFPDAPQSDMDRAVFAGGEHKERVDAIRGFLSYAREDFADLPVRSTADVFGVTTTFGRDIGIGQLWETFIDVVDVALPMVYPSHYWEGSFGYDRPNAYPYEVVRAALRDALRRSAAVEGSGLTRPWLQDFTLGTPVYGGPEVRAQIQAAYDAGIQEWILWNPSSRYTESAIEPKEGFSTDPLMRVAGVLAPVSRRYVVMDSVAALPPAPDSLDAPPDTVRADSLPVDTLAVAVEPVEPREDTLWRDTLDVPDTRVDTLRVDTLLVGVRR